MRDRILTWLLGCDPRDSVCDPRTAKRIVRLENEIEELRTLVEATWARQRKVEGTVHGMRGANARHPSRLTHAEESLEEFRDRMLREGRLTAARSENSHGDN
jgi:hypothetical protein